MRAASWETFLKMLKKVAIIFLCSLIFCEASSSLETKTDDELVEMIKNERYVVVLFSGYFLYINIVFRTNIHYM